MASAGQLHNNSWLQTTLWPLIQPEIRLIACTVEVSLPSERANKSKSSVISPLWGLEDWSIRSS